LKKKDILEFGEDGTPLEIRQLMKEADLGNIEAQFTLGYCYDVGSGGVAINTQEAVYYYQLAAMRGHAIAQNNIGVLYSTGHKGRIPKDAPEAFHWYKKAADKFNNPNAQFHCGLSYINGEGMDKKDDTLGFRYFKKSSKTRSYNSYL